MNIQLSQRSSKRNDPWLKFSVPDAPSVPTKNFSVDAPDAKYHKNTSHT